MLIATAPPMMEAMSKCPETINSAQKRATEAFETQLQTLPQFGPIFAIVFFATATAIAPSQGFAQDIAVNEFPTEENTTEENTAAEMTAEKIWPRPNHPATNVALAGIPMAPPAGTILQADAAIRNGIWKRESRWDRYLGDDYLITNDENAWIEFLTSPDWQNNWHNKNRPANVNANANVDQNLVEDRRAFELRMIYVAHPSLGHSVAVTVTRGGITTTRLMDLTVAGEDGFSKPVGRYVLTPGESVKVRIAAGGAGGKVMVDALWWPSP